MGERVFTLPLVAISIFIAITAYGASQVERGYDGSGGPNAFFALVAIVWTMAVVTRKFEPSSRLAAAVETLALFFAMSVLAAFSSAALAIGGGDFIDVQLLAIDAAMVPLFDWQALVLWLPSHPRIYYALSLVYDSLNWQPFALILVAGVFGTVHDQGRFIGAWAVALALCILPFHWLPALSPYNYFAISPEDMAGVSVSMPWDFLPIMQGLRDGSIQELSIDTVSGMVTIPSFHAAASVVLAGSFWRFRLLRWPMLVLNGGMALAAIPIGSHYVVDILAGAACGALALAVSSAWMSRGARSPVERERAIAPVPAIAR